MPVSRFGSCKFGGKRRFGIHAVFVSLIGGAQSRPSYWLRAQLWEELCSKSAVPIGQHMISGPLNGLGPCSGSVVIISKAQAGERGSI